MISRTRDLRGLDWINKHVSSVSHGVCSRSHPSLPDACLKEGIDILGPEKKIGGLLMISHDPDHAIHRMEVIANGGGRRERGRLPEFVQEGEAVYGQQDLGLGVLFSTRFHGQLMRLAEGGEGVCGHFWGE